MRTGFRGRGIDSLGHLIHNGTIMVPLWMSAMPTLTLKNIPDDIYIQLKEAARLHHRSMNSEILYCVERALCSHPVDVEERLATARRLRSMSASHRLTDDEIMRARNEGRP